MEPIDINDYDIYPTNTKVLVRWCEKMQPKPSKIHLLDSLVDITYVEVVELGDCVTNENIIQGDIAGLYIKSEQLSKVANIKTEVIEEAKWSYALIDVFDIHFTLEKKRK